MACDEVRKQKRRSSPIGDATAHCHAVSVQQQQLRET